VEVEKPGRQGLEELAAEADVVFFSRSWAEAEGYTASKPFLEYQGEKLKARSPILFCTWGAQGSRAYHSGIIEHAKPLTTDVKVVDPVGAGDSFIAGVLFALALQRGNSVSKALRLGITVAEAKVQREGFQGLGETEQSHTTRWLA
jgi:ketohexokinase